MKQQQQHIAFGVGHFDVAGPDPARLSLFDAKVFGWQAVLRSPGYAQLLTPVDSPNDALVEQLDAAIAIGIVDA